jgi:tRNA (cytidine/uridine-2'-O-)-methyltransferase
MFNIVLVEPEIPPNTGNVARLCYANELNLHLVEPLGFPLDDKKLKRAGLDYWPKIKLTVHASWAEFQKKLADQPRYYFSTKGTKNHFEASYQKDSYLIFGKESKGLSEKLILAEKEQVYRIPMVSDQVRSLNLSTAVGIVAYEALRQIKYAI